MGGSTTFFAADPGLLTSLLLLGLQSDDQIKVYCPSQIAVSTLFWPTEHISTIAHVIEQSQTTS